NELGRERRPGLDDPWRVWLSGLQVVRAAFGGQRTLAQKGVFANGSDDPRFAAERFEDRVDRHAHVICDRGDGGRCIPVAQETALGSNEDPLPVLAGPLSAKAGVVGSPGLERPYLLYNRH